MSKKSFTIIEIVIVIVLVGIIAAFAIPNYSKAINKLPNREISELDDVEADWLWDLTDEELKGVELDDVNKFSLVEVIGEAMVDFIMNDGGQFKKDLVNDKNRDLLVTTFGDIKRIKKSAKRII